MTQDARRVPVVDSLAPEVFADLHLRRGLPVIVSPPVDDPLAPLADRAFVRGLLAETPMCIRDGSTAAKLLGEASAETTETTYGAFVDRLVAEPALDLVCSEFATPEPLAQRAAIPHFADVGDPADRVSDMFLAGPAAVAHLHYDADLRDVVMLQLFGRKRYVLIDPVHSAKLLPLTDDAMQRTSGVFLEHLPPHDRAAFLRYTDAYECELGPGAALYLPAGWWHYVEYLDVSLSVNHRLGRNRYLRTLAEQVPVRSVEWLALAQVFRDEAAVDASPGARAAWAELEQALDPAGPLAATDPAQRASILEKQCLALCAELGEAIAGPSATMAELARRNRLMHQPDLEGTDDNDHDAWNLETRVQVPPGSSLFVPMMDRGLALARGGELVALLPPDTVHPWTLPVLARIARQPGVTVAELASVSDAPSAHVLAFLTQMAGAGWIAAAP